MDELKAIFASNLIRLRTEAAMTQAELGERLFYSDKAVSKWERAESMPDAFVLKKLSEIFGVSVDALLSSNSGWVSPEPDPRNETETYSRLFIILCCIAAIWTLCVVEFVLVWCIFGAIQWVVFVAAVPLSLIAVLVFNSIWYHGRRNVYIVALLVLSLVLLIYLLLLKYNLWQMFLVLVPAEIVVFFAFNIRKRGKSTGGRVKKTERRAGNADTRL